MHYSVEETPERRQVLYVEILSTILEPEVPRYGISLDDLPVQNVREKNRPK
jgi:hypothetical protein